MRLATPQLVKLDTVKSAWNKSGTVATKIDFRFLHFVYSRRTANQKGNYYKRISPMHSSCWNGSVFVAV
jgi:hypothetical protein